MKAKLVSRQSLAIAFVVAVTSAPTFGATITSSGSAPVTDIIQQSTANGANIKGVTWTSAADNAHVDAGQSWRYTANAYTLDKITVAINPGTNAATINGSTLTLKVWTYPASDGVNTNSTPSGGEGTPPNVLSETAAVPGGTFTDNTISYITFDVADTLLSAVQQYGFFVGFSGGPNAGYSMNVQGNGSSASYTAGNLMDHNFQDSADSGDNDFDGIGDEMEFYIQGIPVPEPSSFALAGLGLVGAIAARRRRRS